MARGSSATVAGAQLAAIGTPRSSSAQITHPSTSTRCARRCSPPGTAHPRVTIEETGDISASDARDRVVDRDLHRAELLSVPGDAARAPVRVRRGRRGARPGVARADRGRRRVRPARADQPGVPARRRDEDRRAADRHGRRRRLRAVLRHPLARGAPPRPAVARGARAHGAHVRTHGRSSRARPSRSRWPACTSIGSKIFNGHRERRRSPSSPARSPARSRCCRRCSSCSGRGSTAGGSRSCPHLRTDSTDSRFWPAVIDRVLRRPALSCAALGRPAASRSRCPALWLHVAKPSDDALVVAERAGARDARHASARRSRARRRRRSSSSPARRAQQARGAARSCSGSRRSRSRAASRTRRSRVSEPAATARRSLELPLIGARRQRREPPRDRGAPRRARPGDARHDSRASRRRSPAHRRGRRLHAADEARHAVRDRASCSCFAFRAAARRVPLDRRAAEGDRAQPALGRRRLRRARARLPAPLGRAAARLQVERRDHLVAAALPLRRALRAVDGLPRVHPQPGPRGGRRRHGHRRGRALRDHRHRGRRDERGARDGRRVLAVRLARRRST